MEWRSRLARAIGASYGFGCTHRSDTKGLNDQWDTIAKVKERARLTWPVLMEGDNSCCPRRLHHEVPHSLACGTLVSKFPRSVLKSEACRNHP